MTWFKVDDALATHDKVLKAGNSAMGLWVRAGAWCAQHLTDGHVPTHAVRLLGNTAQANALVKAGLWVKVDDGYRFHEWHDYQPTREHVERVRDERRKAGQRGGKKSGESRSKDEANCFDVASTLSNPRPVPSRPDLSVVTNPSQSPSALGALTDEDLQKIEEATKGPRSHAERTAATILARAGDDVVSPRRYILRAIKNEPELFRYHRGNPTRADECGTHAGEWGDNCRICALDRRLASGANRDCR